MSVNTSLGTYTQDETTNEMKCFRNIFFEKIYRYLFSSDDE